MSQDDFEWPKGYNKPSKIFEIRSRISTGIAKVDNWLGSVEDLVMTAIWRLLIWFTILVVLCGVIGLALLIVYGFPEGAEQPMCAQDSIKCYNYQTVLVGKLITQQMIQVPCSGQHDNERHECVLYAENVSEASK